MKMKAAKNPVSTKNIKRIMFRPNTRAPHIPVAVLTFFDTPRKGQRPKNWLSTTLLTSEEPIAIKMRFPI